MQAKKGNTSMRHMPRKRMKKRLAKKWAKLYLQGNVRVRVWKDLVRTDTDGRYEYRCYADMPACVWYELQALTPEYWTSYTRNRDPDLLAVYGHISTGELVEAYFNWSQSDVARMTGLPVTFDESVEVYC